jgi:hypothetical protein
MLQMFARHYRVHKNLTRILQGFRHRLCVAGYNARHQKRSHTITRTRQTDHFPLRTPT